MAGIVACICVVSGAWAQEGALAARLSWVEDEGFRMGYNYCAPLDWYPRAKACGMNAIVSRLEIANDPSGDEELLDQYAPDDPQPDALRCWRLLQPSSRAAKQHGLRFFYMLNMGGSRGNINDGFRDNPRRHNNGKLFSPIDDIYWERVVEARFLRVARALEGEGYQLDGFLIDPEMYAEGGAIPGDVDYGDYALGEFVAETGETLGFEGLTIPERVALVRERGLAGKLREFEFARVKALAQGTREKLQALVPGAIMGFFLWRDVLWFRGLAAGFSTPEVPCFVGPESTYPGAHDEQFLSYRDQVREQADVPILFVPGLSLGRENGEVRAETLRVLMGNLYRRSIETEGYWFWALTRFGATDEERKPFVDMLTTVNGELDRYHAGAGYESALKAGPLPVETPRNLQTLLVDARAWEPVPEGALPENDAGPAGMGLRGLHAFAMKVGEGDEMRVQVRSVQLGAYTAPTACTFYRPGGAPLAQVDVALHAAETVTQRAEEGGVWVLAVTSHNNALWVLPEVERCVLTREGAFGLCKPRGPEGLNRFFFYVPQGTTSFEVEMLASQSEAATFSVYSPAGERVFEERVTEAATPKLDVGRHDGKVWWLETTEVVEDHGFRLVGIPNIVAAKAGQLLVPTE